MTHERQTILQTVRDILLNANTKAGTNVFVNRMTHPKHECLPFILIYSKGETIRELDQAPVRQARTLDLVIELITARTPEEITSEDLQQLNFEVEVALADDDDWNDTVNHQGMTSIRFEFREQGTTPVAAAVMGYDVDYITCRPASLLTQAAADAVDLDRIQGIGPNFGWAIGHDGETHDGVIDAELIIETIP